MALTARKKILSVAFVGALAMFGQASIAWSDPATPGDSNQTPSTEDLLALKQNPVSGLRQLGFQAVFNPDTPVSGKTQSNYSAQIVWPFSINQDWKLITYTILPVVHQPLGQSDGGSVTGLSDTLVNLFIAPKNPGPVVWGIGPAVLLPTRTDPVLGSNHYGFGPSGVLYYAKDQWSAGVVLQNVWSLGGLDINRVNTFAAQYIFNYNLPNGWFLYSNSTVTSNWIADTRNRWTVPVGGGFGKIFNIGKQPVSASVQAFYNVVTPINGPTWTGIFQFSFLFP
jgi:hypothetical protein